MADAAVIGNGLHEVDDTSVTSGSTGVLVSGQAGCPCVAARVLRSEVVA
ncbi:hypothetical protein [Streptomyces sp. NPDC005485]